jgi:hypothetical protein
VRVPWVQVLREPFQQHSRAAASALMTRSTLFRVLANARDKRIILYVFEHVVVVCSAKGIEQQAQIS